MNKNFPDHGATKLLPERSMIQAIGCAHDLGHPPFGHGGEIALNYCMRNHGGFEGNGQTLRILAKLEKFSDHDGANLTRRTLLGLLKYPVSYEQAKNPDITPKLSSKPTTISVIDVASSKPPKCYMDSEKDAVTRLLEKFSECDRSKFSRSTSKDNNSHAKSEHKSFDCSIMDIADDIAYGVHDLEDVIKLDVLKEERFEHHLATTEFTGWDKIGENVTKEKLIKALFNSGHSCPRKQMISNLVGYFIRNVYYDTVEFESNLLKYRVRIRTEAEALLNKLKEILKKEIIESPNVRHLEFKGQKMVVSVFEAIQTEPERLLPRDDLERYKVSQDLRVICDYVAGMTDTHLLKIYERMFSPRTGSVFDRI